LVVLVSLFDLAAPPTFTVKPQDQKVGLNGLASFECVATGNPPPSVFWTKEGSQILMFPGNSYGHFHVTSEGTLKIQGVQREDAGFLVCSALSVAGSTTVRAFLQVCHNEWIFCIVFILFLIIIIIICAGL